MSNSENTKEKDAVASAVNAIVIGRYTKRDALSWLKGAEEKDPMCTNKPGTSAYWIVHYAWYAKNVDLKHMEIMNLVDELVQDGAVTKTDEKYFMLYTTQAL